MGFARWAPQKIIAVDCRWHLKHQTHFSSWKRTSHVPVIEYFSSFVSTGRRSPFKAEHGPSFHCDSCFSPQEFSFVDPSILNAWFIRSGSAELNRGSGLRRAGRTPSHRRPRSLPALSGRRAAPGRAHGDWTLSGLERAGLGQEGETQRAQATRGAGRSRGRSKNARAVLSHKCLKTGIRVPQALKLLLSLNEPFVRLPRCRTTEALSGLGRLHFYQFSNEFDKLL